MLGGEMRWCVHACQWRNLVGRVGSEGGRSVPLTPDPPRRAQAKELGEALKGCSLYLVGAGARKTAIGRVLARRLPRYRFYDLSSLMCSTYQTLSKATDKVSLKQLLAAEPLSDVEELSSALLQEVQQYTRSVHVVWDGSISTANFMVMQQGIVVNVVTEVRAPLVRSRVTLPVPSARPRFAL